MPQHNFSQKQGSIVLKSGVKIPAWICSKATQDVINVIDESGSMAGEKAQAANSALVNFVGELAQPCNKDGFNVAIVGTADDAHIEHPLEKATTLASHLKNLTTGGGTNITAGLQAAVNIIDAAEATHQENMTYLRPVVILFSDGCHNIGSHPRDIANQLKSKADLVTVAFGTDADEVLLRELASTMQHFYRCADGRELRNFLAQVGATLQQTMSSKKNATQALGNIRP